MANVTGDLEIECISTSNLAENDETSRDEGGEGPYIDVSNESTDESDDMPIVGVKRFVDTSVHRDFSVHDSIHDTQKLKSILTIFKNRF